MELSDYEEICDIFWHFAEKWNLVKIPSVGGDIEPGVYRVSISYRGDGGVEISMYISNDIFSKNENDIRQDVGDILTRYEGLGYKCGKSVRNYTPYVEVSLYIHD